VADIATLCFPLWALISGTVAFFHPTSLNWITTSQFEIGVGVLMLSMGLSLSTDDFRKCASNPIPILCGFICQYALLPILAFTLARLMNLPPAMATGLIILGSCPGGQASNVATFVAGGDVALSVLMTTVSTLAAAVMTPALATLLAGQFIPVDAWGLAVSTMQLVLFPTLLGVFLNETFPSAVDKVRPIMPLLALALTVVLMGVPVAQLAPLLKTNGVMALAPVMGLHFFGYLLGYLIPRSLKFNEKTSRTVSIE
jgi:BASS family bile acid:Na+ symporter